MAQFTTNSPILNRAATLAAALLLALAGVRAANLWLQEQYSSPASKVKTAPQSTSKPKNGGIGYGRLVKLHLFGKASKKSSVPPKINTIKAPETSLKLQLIGVIFDRDTEEGIAIISEAKKPQKTFRKNDKLPGGATLYAVEQQRVILERNGRHETLSLKKHDLHPKKSPSKINQRTQPKSRQALPHPPPN